jgi:carboxypeptidase C (cathepsin A)
VRSSVLAAMTMAVATALGCASHAQPQPVSSAPAATLPAESQPTSKPADVSAEKPRDSTTRHSIVVDGNTLNYTATAGTLTMKEENGKEKANIFFIAYTLDDVTDPATRPITFCFNGGPGSSSVWLHMGAWGPKRVEMGDAGSLLAPPWNLVTNESTLLDITDLVFIDPVTTGYSRAVPPEQDDAFHGVQEDIESVGEFIRLWTTRHQRWGSPKFLAGESYGTTRAAGLSGFLQDRQGMFLNGIVLVSAVLNFATNDYDRSNDLPYALYLPSYAATAWYHRRLEAELQRDLPPLLKEVETFAMTDYLLALAKGDALTSEESNAIAQRLSRYTGLSAAFLRQSNLRIDLGRFQKELLREQRRTVGRLDGRFLGIDYDAAGESTEYDPSYAAIQGPYTATFNDYVRRELGFESDLNYEILSGRVRPWNFRPYLNRYVNVAETLRSAMSENPSLRVFVAGGYYDFATPYFAARYTMDHLGLDPSLREHVTFRHYEAGHMMYVHMPSLQQLKADLVQFYESAMRR